MSATASLICHLCTSILETNHHHQDNYNQQKQIHPIPPAAHAGDLCLELPLRSTTTATTTTAANPRHRIPTQDCPFLWFLVIDANADTQSSSSSFYARISQAINQVLLLSSSVPPQNTIRLALLLVHEENQSIGQFQLSPIPHLIFRNCSISSSNTTTMTMMDLQLHSAHLQTVLRSLQHAYVPPPVSSSSQTTSNDNNTNNLHCDVWTTSIFQILQYIHTNWTLLGSTLHNNNSTTTSYYTGAKITLLRGSHHSTIATTTQTTPHFIRAGNIGHSMENNDSTRTEEHVNTTNDPHDMDPNHYHSMQQQEQQQLLLIGKDCVHLAVGVDIISVVPQEHNSNASTVPATPDQIAWAAQLAPLAWTSGAPSPTVCPSRYVSSELEARSPWKHCYAAEMRLRATGMHVQKTAVPTKTRKMYNSHNKKTNDNPCFWYTQGLSGQAVPSEHASQLWKIGCCDEYSTFTIDFQLDAKELQTSVFISNEEGEVMIRPCIQACFAYTTVEVHPDDGQWYTVRRMRVSNLSIPFASSPEKLYNSLDPEALAMVLFQKLAIEYFSVGVAGESPVTAAEEWLLSFLIGVYASAEEQEEIENEHREKGLPPSDGFYPQERLLGRNGDLQSEDILLAQGHERLCTVPLMVFLILQSDALRNQKWSSYQERMLAFLQLASSPLRNFARSIAPRLQLWPASDDGDEEPILDVMDLRMDAIERSVTEYDGCNLLFVDYPGKIVVMNADFVSHYEDEDTHHGGRRVLGKGLRQAISASVDSYRTSPILFKFIAESDKESALSILRSVCREDLPLSASGPANFDEWKKAVAGNVMNSLSESTKV